MPGLGALRSEGGQDQPTGPCGPQGGVQIIPHMPVGTPRPRTQQLLRKHLLRVSGQATDPALPLELQALRICPRRPQGAGSSGLRVPS